MAPFGQHGGFSHSQGASGANPAGDAGEGLRRRLASSVDGLRRGVDRLLRRPAEGEGLTRGDAELLDLLDVGLLKAEARTADVAAGRVGCPDPAARALDAAVVWREVARRTGDVAALRKAASHAERAAARFQATGRRPAYALARLEQAECSLLGAVLMHEDGLAAAADAALAEAEGAASGAGADRLAVARARCAAILSPATDAAGAWAQAQGFDAPLRSLGKRDPVAAARGRLERAQVLAQAGARLRDQAMLEAAVTSLTELEADLDPCRAPLLRARAQALLGVTLTALGESTGEALWLIQGAAALGQAADMAAGGHSPLDLARARHGECLARLSLAMLEEGEARTDAFEAAEAATKDAAVLYKRAGMAMAHAAVLADQATVLTRRAEAEGDAARLAEAETQLRLQLAGYPAAADPAGWAVRQLTLAQLYEARLAIEGPDGPTRRAAGEAFAAALEVFGELGQRSLALLADDGLRRLRAMAAAEA